jgi:hypothetical protein
MMGNVIDGTKNLLGRGKVHFAPYSALGVPTGAYLFLGNAPKITFTPTQEEIKKYGSTTAQARLMASDVLKSELALQMTLDHFNKENLCLALFGTLGTAITQSASTAVAESVPDVIQDRSYRLAHRKVSSVVVKDATPTTYTVATDYTVDADTGMVYIVPGGTIAEGTDLLIDYSYAAIAAPGYAKVQIGAEGVKRGSILFIPDNQRGPQMEHTLWRVTLRASGGIDFISDNYAEFTLDGYAEDDSVAHPLAPYGETIYRTGS